MEAVKTIIYSLKIKYNCAYFINSNKMISALSIFGNMTKPGNKTKKWANVQKSTNVFFVKLAVLRTENIYLKPKADIELRVQLS